MRQKSTGRIEIIKKGRDTILKFNPYHGYHGYFSSRDAHSSFSPGSNAANAARAIARENKRRIAEGNTDLIVNGAYTVTLHGKKATYAETRQAMKQGTGKGSGPEPKGSDDPPADSLIHAFKASKVEFKEVSPLSRELPEEEIIQKLSGRDRTKGSCVSLACAYIANKAGLDVTDYRGGKSRETFALHGNNKNLSKLKGVRSKIVMEKNDYTALKKLTSDMMPNKQYLMVIGHHASMVRKNDSGQLQYLELQADSGKNGWKDWRNGYTEKKRFGMQKSYSIAKMKYAVSSYIIDPESLYENKDFRSIMGYINTNPAKQKKDPKSIANYSNPTV